MGRIHDRIAKLESALINCKAEHEGADLADMEEELFQLGHIKDLWEKLGCVAIDTETENTEDGSRTNECALRGLV